MKKFFAMILAVTIALGLTSCSHNDKTISKEEINKLIYGATHDINTDNSESVMINENLRGISLDD